MIEEQLYSMSYSPNIVVHSTIVIPYFYNYGTKAQQEEYIPALVAGDRVGSIAMTEPDAGSDLQVK